MAQRRMFNQSITSSDQFLDMPASTQNLYFHLNMEADDDGFVNSPNKVMRQIGASKNDMDLLLTKQYVFIFESGVVVIRHWKIHNYIQKDRYKPTIHVVEKSELEQDESKAYTKCIQGGRLGKVRLGKNSIGKNSIGKNSIEENNLDERLKIFDNEIGEWIENVNITNNQFENLCNVYDIEVVKETIFKMENWTKQKKKNKYDDYNRALHNWLKNGNPKKTNKNSIQNDIDRMSRM